MSKDQLTFYTTRGNKITYTILTCTGYTALHQFYRFQIILPRGLAKIISYIDAVLRQISKSLLFELHYCN